MSQQETGEVVADEVSHEVDSRDEKSGHDGLYYRKTRNVFDCDQSNYSSRIIFSHTFTLEPNTNWTE